MNKFFNKIWFPFVLFIIVAPFLCSIFFSVPANDDFSMAVGGIPGAIQEQHCSKIVVDISIFERAFNDASYFYATWGGGWPYSFIQVLLNPLVYFSSSSYMYGLVLCFLFIVFLVVCYLFVKCTFNLILKYDNIVYIRIYFCLIIFIFLNLSNYCEVFYWFVGNSYAWGISLIMLNVMFIFKMFSTHFRTSTVILCSVIGFIACFDFKLAVIPGLTYVIEYVLYLKRNKKFSIIMLIPLIFMVSGGFISLLAPGNFIRHQTNAALHISGSLSFFMSILTGVKNSFEISLATYTNPLFMFACVIVVVLGYKTYKNFKYNIRVFIGLFLFQFIFIASVCVPVAIGYAFETYPNRLVFLVNCIICFYGLFSMFYLGGLIKFQFSSLTIMANALTKILIVSVLFVSVYLFMPYENGTTNLSKLPVVYLTNNIVKIHDSSCAYKNLYKNILNSPSKDVYIQSKQLNSINSLGVLYPPLIAAEDDFSLHWLEDSMACYFDKDHIWLK